MEGGRRPIRVLLVDDQAMVRTGFRLILELQEDFEVVGEAEDGARAVDLARLRRPDVVLMDIQMPRLDGLDATRRLLARTGDRPEDPSPKVVILTTFERDDYVFEALRAGASGFLLKNAPPADLVAAIRVVVDGGALLAPSVTRRLIEAFARMPAAADSPADLAELTERELEVLRLLARGLTNQEIAEQLVVGEATVKTHVSNILAKLRLRDRVQAAIAAYETGLVVPGSIGDRLPS